MEERLKIVFLEPEEALTLTTGPNGNLENRPENLDNDQLMNYWIIQLKLQ